MSDYPGSILSIGRTKVSLDGTEVFEGEDNHGTFKVLTNILLEGATAEIGTITTRTNVIMSPSELGGDISGTNDASSAILLLNSQTSGFITLLPGQNYRVSSNININKILNLGGKITIDSGKVLTYDEVVGPCSLPIFDGAGIARPSNMKFHFGHYCGNSADAKWTRMRGAFITSVHQTVYFDAPNPSDPAFMADSYGNPGYVVLNPMIVDDPDDNTKFIQECSFVAGTNNMTCIFEFSPINKTEDIYWSGMILDCKDMAVDGLLMHGGARIRHPERARITSAKRDAIHQASDLWPLDDCAMGYLEAVRFGRRAIHLEGMAQIVSSVNNEIFSNGARTSFCTATVSAGGITSLTINPYYPDGVTPQTQVLGFDGPGLVFNAVSLAGGTGTGTGCVVTPNFDVTPTYAVGAPVSHLTGWTVTAPGINFTNGEVVQVNACDTTYYIGGATRNVTVPSVEDAIVNISTGPVNGCYNAIVTVESTSNGASWGLLIDKVFSRFNPVTLIQARAGAGGTANLHQMRIMNPTFANLARNANQASPVRFLLELGQCTHVTVDGIPGLPYASSATVLQLQSNVSAAYLNGNITQARVAQQSGTYQAYYNGDLSNYYPGLADQSATSVSVWSNTNPSYTFKEVTIGCTTTGVFFRALYCDTQGWVDVVAGSLVQAIVSTTTPTGSSTTSGLLTVQMQNDATLWVVNRTGGALRMVVTVR